MLVNNAGYGSYGAVEDVPIDEARRQFEVNVFGLARLIQLVTPHMREQERRPDHQRLLDRREVLRAAGRLVPRHQVRAGGLQRQPAPRARALRHPGRHHRARADHHRVEHHLRDSLVETSRGGACEERAGRVSQTMERGGSGWTGTQPVVVARKILKAATTSPPRARYPVGRGAGSLVLARRLMPDRAFDAMVSTMYR